MKDIREYFKDRFTAVDNEFREWTDAFNITNIPSTFYNKSFHIAYGEVSGGTLSGKTQQIGVPIIISCGFKGYRNVSENLDKAMDSVMSVIEETQKPQNRLGEKIKNVKFNSMRANESFDNNDNLILITQNYEVTMFLCSGG